mgnify:FL=1
MQARRGLCKDILPLLGIMLCMGSAGLRAQEESAEETQYREDYDRTQKIVAISDPVKRADQLITFIKERPNSKLIDYAQAHLFQVLDTLVKSENAPPLLALSDRFIKLRPRVGETYYFYGSGLKIERRFPEAMDALAKCYVLRNRISNKAKEFLEYIYKGQHQGSLVGLDKIIKKAQDEVGK